MAKSYSGDMRIHFVLSQTTDPHWRGAKGRIKLEDVKSRLSELQQSSKWTFEGSVVVVLVIVCLDSLINRLTQNTEQLRHTEAFICGPEGFMQHLETILQDISLSGENILLFD